jgi:hypothetical protein
MTRPQPKDDLVLLSPNLDGRLTSYPPRQDDLAARATPIEEPAISGPLTWEQICEQYPNEWVCLVEMKKLNDTDFDFRTARVVGHGKTRRAPLEQSRSFREAAGYREAGHYFTRCPAPSTP